MPPSAEKGIYLLKDRKPIYMSVLSFMRRNNGGGWWVGVTGMAQGGRVAEHGAGWEEVCRPALLCLYHPALLQACPYAPALSQAPVLLAGMEEDTAATLLPCSLLMQFPSVLLLA